MAAVPLAARRSRGPHHPRCERDVCSSRRGLCPFPVSSWGAGRRAQRLLANRSHGSPPPSQLRVRIPLAISTKINASDKNPDITNEGCQMALYGPYDAI